MKIVMMSGGIPASAPTAAMGWREWWNPMDISTLYQGAQTTPVTADGQSVYDMNGNLGVVATSYFRQATAGSRPLYKTGGAGGKSYLSFDGTDDYMESREASNYLAVGAKTILVAMALQSGTVSPDGVIGDTSSAYQYVRVAASNVLQYTSYDTGYKYSTGVNYVDNTPFIYAVKHDTGKLYDAKDGVTWTAGVTAGNTGSLTFLQALGRMGTAYPVVRIYSAAMANVVISDANLTLCVNYFKQQLGIA